MPSDPRVRFGVAAVVARPTPYPDAMIDPQFLVIRRAGEPPAEGAGTWSIPGGWLDDGETLTEAARRECWEEAGIECGAPPGPGLPATVTTHRSVDLVLDFARRMNEEGHHDRARGARDVAAHLGGWAPRAGHRSCGEVPVKGTENLDRVIPRSPDQHDGPGAIEGATDNRGSVEWGAR